MEQKYAHSVENQMRNIFAVDVCCFYRYKRKTPRLFEFFLLQIDRQPAKAAGRGRSRCAADARPAKQAAQITNPEQNLTKRIFLVLSEYF